MLSHKERLNAELDALLARLALTPECIAVEEFLAAHPDVELGFIALFKINYARHTHSVRIMRGKAERNTVKTVDFQAMAVPQSGHPEVMQAGELLRKVRADVPGAADDLALMILMSGWDLARKMPQSVEDERFFIVDMAEGKLRSEPQKQRLMFSGQEFVRWLIKKHAGSVSNGAH